MRMQRQSGFSIIEIVVTLAVLAMILVAAGPSIGTWMDNTRIRNTAQALQEGLQMARAEAVRRNQAMSFYLVSLTNPGAMDNSCALSSTSGSWVVAASSPALKCATAPSDVGALQIAATRTVNDGGGRVAVSGLQADGTTAANTVTFNGFGRVTNTTPIAQIQVTGTDANATYRNLWIEITSAGAVRMCDPKVTDGNDPRKCTSNPTP